MRHYELMVVLSPILSPEEVASSKDRIKGLIDQQGGTIVREDQWGMRRLAYPIRKAGQTFLEGNYLLTQFATEGVLSRTLEGQLNLSEDVLRYLVVKSEPPKETPPPATEAPASELQGDGQAESTPAVAVVDQAVSDGAGSDEPVVEEPSAEAAVAEVTTEAPQNVEDAEPPAPENLEGGVDDIPSDETSDGTSDAQGSDPQDTPTASIEETEAPVNVDGEMDSLPDGPDEEGGGDTAGGAEDNGKDGETQP